jgi:hypothetical protein
VKLNRATDVSHEEDLDYSSFWVLIPMFLVALFVLTVFGCCIFATPSKLFEQQQQQQQQQQRRKKLRA